MDAAITSKMQKHYPVLLKEIISIISPQYGGTFIDCTFGQGGYTKKILEFDKTRVIALDRDAESKKVALKLEEKFEDRFKFKNIKFSQLKNLKLKNENVRGVLFDLGYAASVAVLISLVGLVFSYFYLRSVLVKEDVGN